MAKAKKSENADTTSLRNSNGPKWWTGVVRPTWVLGQTIDGHWHVLSEEALDFVINQ